jgi:hypothetical protein
MAVVSVAITLSFHVKNKPSHLELRMAKPLGAVFWALSVLMLILGLGNYIRESVSSGSRLYSCPCGWLFTLAAKKCVVCTGTVNKYSRKAAIVQTGWKTQLVSSVSITQDRVTQRSF